MSVSTAYTCRFCRLSSEGASASCPHCGAPVDVRVRVTDSGWVEQPPVRDMARIQFGRSTCQIEGTCVPTADMGLVAGDRVYFSHHVLLWCDSSVSMEALPMQGGWNRVYAGMPLVMMQAEGPGHIAFSQDAPGETVALPLRRGQEVDVREHRFLVATGNVGYSWFDPGIWYQTGSGDDTETHYPLGRYVDRFRAEDGPGLLLLHAPGNTFIRDLGPGETICVQPSSLLYKDASVGMQLHFEYPSAPSLVRTTGLSGITWLLLSGAGRVAVQSVFTHQEAPAYITGHSPASHRRW